MGGGGQRVPRPVGAAGHRRGPRIRARTAGGAHVACVSTDVVVLDAAVDDTRTINRALRALPDGARARIEHARGRHNLAVGLHHPVTVDVVGNAGYYCGALGERATVRVDGSVGWCAGENLMSGSVTVRGHAGQSTGASAHGGLVVVHGDAGARTAISLKGGRVAVAGSIGHAGAFMAQAGVLLVGGDAGDGLGDSLYEATVFVAGRIASLGADARVEDLTDDDVAVAVALADEAGFDHIDATSLTKVTSARSLYRFDALAAQRY
ncbi:MAG: glutamate synthase [Acidimicrobiia bacterium]|nr:glutamate synthase [Acidimicrobiia bacterium]